MFVGVVPSPDAKIIGLEIPGVLVESIVGTSFGVFDVLTIISISGHFENLDHISCTNITDVSCVVEF